VQASATTINGVAVPAGVYMNDAYIRNGTITSAKIGNAAIDDAKIANLSAAKITAGSLAVGQYIQSSNYIQGAQGWRFNADGSMQVMAANVAGQLTAAQINARGLSLQDAAGNVILAAGVALADANIPAAARNSALALGANLCFNSDWSKGLFVGWTNWGGGLSNINVGLNFANTWCLYPMGVAGNDTIFIEQTTGYQNGSYWEVASDPIAVTMGKNYAVSAFSGAHRCTVAIYAWLYDINGNTVGHFYVGGKNENGSEAAGGKYLGDFKRIYAVKPIYETGAAYVRVFIRKYDTYNGNGNSYAFISRAQFEEVGATATEPGPYNPCGYEDRTTVTASKPITAGNVSTYIASAAIGNAQIGNSILSYNFNGAIQSDGTMTDVGTAGWAISKQGKAVFSDVTLRGKLMGGAFTGYAWPGAGQTGFYLGSEGLLLGNAAGGGRYFQVTAAGDVLSTAFDIVNGAMTVKGSGVITTLNIASNSVTLPLTQSNNGSYWGSNGSTNSMQWDFTFTMPNAGKLIVLWHGEQGTTGNTVFNCTVYINGVASGYTRGGGTMQDSPNVMAFGDAAAGTCTVRVIWAASDGMNLSSQKLIILGAQR